MQSKPTPIWYWIVLFCLFLGFMGFGIKAWWGKVIMDQRLAAIAAVFAIAFILAGLFGMHFFGPKYKH